MSPREGNVVAEYLKSEDDRRHRLVRNKTKTVVRDICQLDTERFDRFWNPLGEDDRNLISGSVPPGDRIPFDRKLSEQVRTNLFRSAPARGATIIKSAEAGLQSSSKSGRRVKLQAIKDDKEDSSDQCLSEDSDAGKSLQSIKSHLESSDEESERDVNRAKRSQTLQVRERKSNLLRDDEPPARIDRNSSKTLSCKGLQDDLRSITSRTMSSHRTNRSHDRQVNSKSLTPQKDASKLPAKIASDMSENSLTSSEGSSESSSEGSSESSSEGSSDESDL